MNIPLIKEVYNKNTVSNVIDRNFKSIIPSSEIEEQSNLNEINTEQFFELYESLFFEIPKDGEINSHQYLINKSSEYLNIKNPSSLDIQLLQEEITFLRQQLLDANKMISNIKTSGL